MNNWNVYVKEVKWNGLDWVTYGNTIVEELNLSYEESEKKYKELCQEYTDEGLKNNNNYSVYLKNIVDDMDSISKDSIVGKKNNYKKNQ